MSKQVAAPDDRHPVTAPSGEGWWLCKKGLGLMLDVCRKAGKGIGW